MTILVFDDLGGSGRRTVEVKRVLIVGFAGRDGAAVADHVDELAALRVPVPEHLPTLYEVSVESLRQSTVLAVAGPETSGEVEAVLVVADGELYLTVGSDHTDRAIERVDIASSKAACAKVVGTSWIPVVRVREWDAISLQSFIDAGTTEYQHGTLASLLPLDEIRRHLRTVHHVELADGDAVFLGTVPVIGGIRPSPTFRGELTVPGFPERLTVDYRVIDTSSSGRRAWSKPELEFFDAANVHWTPVPGGADGQTERVLAADPTTGIATRMLRFDPGTDTSALGVVRHDFWEEVYILSGELHDLTLDATFVAGTYACRPPGMPHGPWRSASGCVTFEVRYPTS